MKPQIIGHMTDKSPNGQFEIERVVYENEENGWAVLRMVPLDSPAALPVTAVGNVPNPVAGACYDIEGEWQKSKEHGYQVQIKSAKPFVPATVQGIERYLASGAIPGVGKHYAHLLAENYGSDTLAILDAGAPNMEDISGIGKKRAALIRQAWLENRHTHSIMERLQGEAGLSARQAQTLYKELGDQAWEKVRSNPYRLQDILAGVGFKTCDKIARNMGLGLNDPARIRAGLLYVLEEALHKGDLWLPEEAIKAQATDLLQLSTEEIETTFTGMVAQEDLILEVQEGQSAVYLARVYYTETRIADDLAQLLASPRPLRAMSRTKAEELVDRLQEFPLTEAQHNGIVEILCGAPLHVITGGPGTGKTTVMRTLIRCLEDQAIEYALCATTGRASKQLESATQRPAATVHRHLKLGTPGEPEPLYEDILIIDESSMIDLWLMAEISQRLRIGQQLVLVGDIDQLPSVGPGTVLQDIIQAGASCPGISVTRLDTIFRQEKGSESLIVTNCHRIRQGELPIKGDSEADYFEMSRDSAEQARDLAIELVTRRLPAYLDIDPLQIQLLAPMHRGTAGIAALNTELQQKLNPPAPRKPEVILTHGGEGPARVFRLGDKVRQTRNNYQKQVLNGDIGLIDSVSTANRQITVRFDNQLVPYEADELLELVHSWAMTVHAAQGSQWPAVVILMISEHYVMLERNILYTALSRAERLAVLVSDARAVGIAVKRQHALDRHSGLAQRIVQATAQAAAY